MLSFQSLYFLLLPLAFSCVLVDAQISSLPHCKFGILPRREWRTLSNEEQQHFISLIKKVQERDENDPNSLSFFDKHTKMHGDGAGPVHGHAMLFPWHRYFISNLEQELQRLSDVPVSLPYWQWQMDASHADTSPIFDDNTFGKDGADQPDAKGYNCVTTGKFVGYTTRGHASAGEHCLARQFNGNAQGQPHTLGALYSSELINGIMTTYSNYDDYRAEIEGAPHGGVHVAIGGDMGAMYSPADPLFYLHHANVDSTFFDSPILPS